MVNFFIKHIARYEKNGLALFKYQNSVDWLIYCSWTFVGRISCISDQGCLINPAINKTSTPSQMFFLEEGMPLFRDNTLTEPTGQLSITYVSCGWQKSSDFKFLSLLSIVWQGTNMRLLPQEMSTLLDHYGS